MGQVKRELALDFGHHGKCSVAITNRLLRRIDGGLKPSSFMASMARMSKAAEAAQRDRTSIEAADFPLFDLVYIISEVAREGGIDVDEDDLYDDVSADLAAGGGVVMPIVQELYEMITPPGASEKNLPAPEGAKPKSKRKPKRK